MGKKIDSSRFGVHDRTPEIRRYAERVGNDRAVRDAHDATFGRGPLANSTGNVFKDDAFFNPWAQGGAFDRSSRRGGGYVKPSAADGDRDSLHRIDSFAGPRGGSYGEISPANKEPQMFSLRQAFHGVENPKEPKKLILHNFEPNPRAEFTVERREGCGERGRDLWGVYNNKGEFVTENELRLEYSKLKGANLNPASASSNWNEAQSASPGFAGKALGLIADERAKNNVEIFAQNSFSVPNRKFGMGDGE